MNGNFVSVLRSNMNEHVGIQVIQHYLLWTEPYYYGVTWLNLNKKKFRELVMFCLTGLADILLLRNCPTGPAHLCDCHSC